MTMGTYHMTLHVTHHVTYQHVTLGTYDPMTLGR